MFSEQDADLEAKWALLPERSIARRACRDLTHEVFAGEHPQIVGQRSSLQLLMSLLSWAGGRNVILVGPSGVGKSSLVVNLAQKIVADECPKVLQGRRVLQTNAESLYALAADSNDPYSKERQILRELFREVREHKHILFYDNFHSLMIYPITRLLIMEETKRLGSCMIAASQTEHYYNFSQKDRPLIENFIRLDVEEPSIGAVLPILESRMRTLTKQETREEDHEALKHLIELTDRFISYTANPGRSIRVLESVIFERNVNKARHPMTRLRDAHEEWFKKEQEEATQPIQIDELNEAISRIVRLPIEALVSPRERILGMELFLNARVLGQGAAISKLCKRLMVTKSKTSVDPNRPDGVFLFAGPTGVGKTELARALAEYIAGSPEDMVRLDMSAYSDPLTVRNLLGEPGKGRGTAEDFPEMPFLTQQLQERPYTVLLLDEIEKACNDVRLLFLHGIDTGRMHDNRGNTIILTNAIVVMTSNLGFSTRIPVITHPGRTDEEVAKDVDNAVLKSINEAFPPEFLGRIDEILVFKPLTLDIMRAFVLQKIQALQYSTGKKITVTDAAVQHLCDRGFTAEFGARQLNRAVDTILGYPLALFKTQVDWEKTTLIHVDRKGESEELVVTGE